MRAHIVHAYIVVMVTPCLARKTFYAAQKKAFAAGFLSRNDQLLAKCHLCVTLSRNSYTRRIKQNAAQRKLKELYKGYAKAVKYSYILLSQGICLAYCR